MTSGTNGQPKKGELTVAISIDTDEFEEAEEDDIDEDEEDEMVSSLWNVTSTL